jgi:hypothetical protein
MKRNKHYTAAQLTAKWSVEQDCYLIEHAAQSMEQLQKALPFNEEEINARKKVLGLIKRQRALQRLR